MLNENYYLFKNKNMASSYGISSAAMLINMSLMCSKCCDLRLCLSAILMQGCVCVCVRETVPVSVRVCVRIYYSNVMEFKND